MYLCTYVFAIASVFPVIHVFWKTSVPLIKIYIPYLQFVLASIYIATGDAIRLIEYLGFVDTLVYILSMSCVLYLRIKKPYLHRPFKVSPVEIYCCHLY